MSPFRFRLSSTKAKSSQLSRGKRRGSYRPLLELLEGRDLPSIFMVTSNADSGAGTLRTAITSSNMAGGSNTIDFAITGSGVQEIALASPLPSITTPVVVDGSSQPGFTPGGAPVIQVDGTNAGAGASGFVITTAGVTIKDLDISDFSSNGILVESSSNIIQGNYIGTDPTGTIAEPNGDGVLIQDTASFNLIGTTGTDANPAFDRNIISGNAMNGVALTGSGVTENVIAGNYIGTNVTGSVALGNAVSGIAISSGSSSNQIGNAGAGGAADQAQANVISGNKQSGIAISGIGSNDNLIAGNLVGVAVGGTTALGNGHAGVIIFGSSSGGPESNLVGTNGLATANADEANVLSANGFAGVLLQDCQANMVAGNFIGTGAGGVGMPSNTPTQPTGLVIEEGATSNFIGTNGGGNPGDAAEKNIISGNSGAGLSITDTGTEDNQVSGNWIGLDANGNPLPNGHDGLTIINGASNNLIGTNSSNTDTAAEPNVISGNKFNGIRIQDPGTDANVVAGNFIGTNPAGNALVPNSNSGVLILNAASDNQIGKSASGVNQGNVIAGNETSGVIIENASTAGNTVFGNFIGTNSSGTLNLGNVGDGVVVMQSAAGNQIGISAATANIIAFNSASGVLIQTAAADNPIEGNSIFSNAAANGLLGINLGGSSTVLPNHTGGAIIGDPNGDENYPVLTSAIAGSSSVISGMMENSAPNTAYTIDLYANTTPDASGFGQGQIFLGSITTSSTDSNGNVSFSATLPVPTTSGQYITATATDPSGNTSEFAQDIVAGPAATQYVITANPSSITAGGSTSVTVRAEDASGDTAIGYLGTVHFTSSDSLATLPADYTFTTADMGVHTFMAILRTGGLQTITGTDTVDSSITGNTTVTVSAAAVAKLAISAPASAMAGTPFSVTVSAEDAFGNLATGYKGTVHFSTSDTNPAVNLPPNSTLTNGTGMFSVTLGTAGTQTVSTTDTVNSSLEASANVNVAAAQAAKLDIAAPGGTSAGAPFNVTVTLLDPFGNIATGYTGTVHFSSSDPLAMLPNDYTFSPADAGMHTFGSVVLETAGNQTITAADTVNSSLTGSTSVAVTPGAATHFGISAPSSSVAGAPFSVTVKALDQFGNIATSYTGTVMFTSSDSKASLPGNFIFTSSDQGVHAFPSGVTLFTAGSQTISATDTVNSSLTGTATVGVSPAAATKFSISGPGTAQPGTPFSIVVTAVDPYGNTATGYTGTVHFTSSDSLASLPANSTLTGGTGTFSVTLKTPGFQSISATDTVNSSITGSLVVGVSSAVPTHYVIGAPASTSAGSPFTVTVTVEDQFGNVVTSYAGTVHFTSSDPLATLPGDYTFTAADMGMHTFTDEVTFDTQGTQTLTATDTFTGSITGMASVNVTPAVATHFLVTGPASATAGTAFKVTVTALDPFGNVSTSYSGTVHFSTSDTNAGVVLPPDAALTNGTGMFNVTLATVGTQTITATDTVTSSISGSTSVMVTPAAASSFSITGPVSVTAGTPFNIHVTALDRFGNVATGYTGSVAFTSSDPLAKLPPTSPLTNGEQTFTVTMGTWDIQTITGTDTVNSSLSGTLSLPVFPDSAITIPVTSADDDNDGGTFLNPKGADGTFSLREAIELANANTPFTNTIVFQIGSGIQTINLTQALPGITNPVIVDGAAPAGMPTQKIVVNGSGAGISSGLDISAGNTMVEGDDNLSFINFSGAGSAGIMIQGAGNDIVQGVLLGINFSSTAGPGNEVGLVISGSSGNTIGGSVSGTGNFISGNVGDGVDINGSAATDNVFDGNVIGTGFSGATAVPNGGFGIVIEGGASDNDIGGVGAKSDTNLISGNDLGGIRITGAGTTGNVIVSDVIGADSTGEIAVGNRGPGIQIDSGAHDNLIGSTTGGAINLISGNVGDGILIGLATNDASTRNNVVDSNAIGTDVAGTRPLDNGGDGIHIEGGASDNTVGGNVVNLINLIAANSGWGVVIDGGGAGTGPGGNVVDSNAIGTDVTGTAALGNTLGGVEIINGAADNEIGGVPGVINLIAGNLGDQVLIDGSDSNAVTGNAIGTDVTGDHRFGVGADGVRLQNGASDNLIGSTVAGVFNLISGNPGNGITISDPGTDNNLVLSNAIGTTVDGMQPLPNNNGVVIENGATGNSLGKAGSNIVNLISGNTNDGVLIMANGNALESNVIGADVSGAGPLGNGASGVEISGNNNLIGQSVSLGTFSENIIAFNAKNGVLVDAGTGNTILVDLIFANGSLGIDLVPGSNNSIMPPTLTSVTTGSAGIAVSGGVTGAANTAYLVEVFASPNSGGQGQSPLGYAMVMTNSSGSGTFTFQSGFLPSGDFVTATVTDPNGNTSEFSAPLAS